MLWPMKLRVAAVGFGALALLGGASCGSSGGTGAPAATTIRIGTPSYQTLPPQVTSTVPAPTVVGSNGVVGIVPGEQTYTVKSGDIMVRIASKFCITAQDIVDYNGWADSGGFSHPLFAGDVVRIPPNSCGPDTGTTDPATAATAVGGTGTPEGTTTTVASGPTYTVQAGDYLLAIAQKTGTTVEEIVAANQWPDGDKHNLIPGQKIKLPVKAE